MKAVSLKRYEIQSQYVTFLMELSSSLPENMEFTLSSSYIGTYVYPHFSIYWLEL